MPAESLSAESFRFIHASDFHLERPLGDLDELPAHLRDAMAAAPFTAGDATFEAALSGNIDFVVLSGDLLHPQSAGPYAMSWLLNHFERLAAAKIPVFWAAGVSDDPTKWPDAVPLPPNVTLFPKDRATSTYVTRAGRTICEVIGQSSDGRSSLHVPSYEVPTTDEFTVGVGYGTSRAEALAEARIDYCALGGKHNRTEIDGGATSGAVYCGTPQGRELSEHGPHGYSQIDVDADRNVRVHEVHCDAFRYCMISLDPADIASVGNIRNLMGERITRLQHDHGGRNLILGWDVSVQNGEQLQSIGDSQELLAWLRQQYGHGTPSAWTASLRIRPPKQYPKSWTEEDTILGDYLRIAADHHQNESRELSLLAMTEQHEALPATTASLLADVPAGSQTEILEQATLLGAELLRGGKPYWVQKS